MTLRASVLRSFPAAAAYAFRSMPDSAACLPSSSGCSSLSDLRHEAKRQAYQWLCSECYYVFPAAVAEAHEIHEPFGVWVLHGDPEAGHFEMLRPARHAACALPLAVWLALAKSAPMRSENEAAQALLGEEPHDLP